MHTENVYARLEAAVRGYVIAQAGGDPSGDLSLMPLGELVTVFFSWRARHIPARPRICHVSQEMQASATASEHKDELAALIAKIEAGADLTPHLSRGVVNAYEPGGDKKKTWRRSDRDLLIADWGVHHLHLSGAVEQDGFVERADDLLFAMFTKTDSYLIGIYPHGSWGLVELLEIVVRNWPDAGLMLPTHAIGLTQKWTDAERLELRNGGIASPFIELDGKVWAASALGQSLDGKASKASVRSMDFMWRLGQWEDDPEHLLAEAERVMNDAAGRALKGNWTPMVDAEGTLGLLREDVFYGLLSLADSG
ncbi:MAG TPA: hypothetical protein VL979_03465 [Solirubrobacteraceae bacterium]|nr:hypothetical protein [Solirubrobacteraceae bacterium]